MNRVSQRQADRKRVLIALGVSVAVHAVAFGTLKLQVPAFEESERGRALQLVDLDDQWTDRATQVIALEMSAEFPEATDGAGAETTSATSAQVEAAARGAGGVETTVASLTDMIGEPGLAPGAPDMALELVAIERSTPVVAVATRRANRGIVRREAVGGAAGVTGFDFVASSDAARDRERDRGGNGFGGTGGIGVSIIGGGVDCDTPSSGLGRYPGGPGFGAINRIGPGR